MTDPAITPAAPAPPVPASRRATAVEAGIVFGLTVGLSLAGSLWHGVTAQAAAAFTNAHLLGLVAYEALLAMLLGPWLGRRGWSPRAVAAAPGPADVARGAGLWLLALACAAATWVLFAVLQPEAARVLAAERRFTGAPPSPVAIVLASVVNPLFEELLWLGYGVTRLAPRLGLRGACALSVVLRVAVHAYQGPWAVLGVLPLGVAFTWYYGRTRRLWPVVVAHVLLDAVGLAQRLAAQ